MAKHGKKYAGIVSTLEAGKQYTLAEATEILVKTSPTKFDASAEVHINLGVDPKFADQLVRGTVSLPNGTGKDVRIIAFVDDDKVKEAMDAGAMEAGKDTLIEKVSKGFTDFDMAVATPDVMKDLGKVAKVLGPKGLMPSPKAGTVTPDIAKAIGEMKKGRIEFKVDKQGIVHAAFGKVSFGAEKLSENLKVFVKAIQEAKPSGAKGTYLNGIHLTTSMGPSLKVDIKSL